MPLVSDQLSWQGDDDDADSCPLCCLINRTSRFAINSPTWVGSQRQRGNYVRTWEFYLKLWEASGWRSLGCCLLMWVAHSSASSAGEEPAFLLAAELAAGDTSRVTVTLEVGGEMLVDEETGTKRLPLTVAGELEYTEQLVTWSADPAGVARSLRDYQTATAKIQVDDGGIHRKLPDSQRLIVAEIRDGRSSIGWQ